MSFDTHYPNRKDRRKPYRGAGRNDRACRPGGTCPYCQRNREYRHQKREPFAGDRPSPYDLSAIRRKA